MGMDGRQPQTLEQVGLEHDISRERVRGIVEKLKKTGQLPVYRPRLDIHIKGRGKKPARIFGISYKADRFGSSSVRFSYGPLR
jgi:hypothetical protein